MTFPACPREKEISTLLRSGGWPAAGDADLRLHAQSCRRCGELVLVTQAFQAARESSVRAAQLPSPGLLWWKAQLRRRNAAVERIARPVSRAQGFALGLYLAVALGLAITQWSRVTAWLGSLKAPATALAIPAPSPLSNPLPSQLSEPSALDRSLGFIQQIFVSASSPTAAGHAGSLLMLVSCAVALALLGGVAVYFASERQ